MLMYQKLLTRWMFSRISSVKTRTRIVNNIKKRPYQIEYKKIIPQIIFVCVLLISLFFPYFAIADSHREIPAASQRLGVPDGGWRDQPIYVSTIHLTVQAFENQQLIYQFAI